MSRRAIEQMTLEQQARKVSEHSLAADHEDGLHDYRRVEGCAACEFEHRPRRPPETLKERQAREARAAETVRARQHEAEMEVSIACPTCSAVPRQSCRRMGTRAYMSRAHKTRRATVGLTGRPL